MPIVSIALLSTSLQWLTPKLAEWTGENLQDDLWTND